jgi:hypothetical protein
MLHECHVIYSVRYYPLFHVTAAGLGTYYPRIWGHTYIDFFYLWGVLRDRMHINNFCTEDSLKYIIQNGVMKMWSLIMSTFKNTV